MSFQGEIDKIFASTLYGNYNKELSVVVGKSIDIDNELDNSKQKIEEDLLSK